MSSEQYDLEIGSFTIHTTRSLLSDRVFVTASVVVGSGPPISLTKRLGDLRTGIFNPDILLRGVEVADDEHVVLAYALISSRHADPTTIERQLESGVASLATAGAAARVNVSGNAVFIVLDPATGTTLVPLIDTALEELAGWLESSIDGLIAARCDGPVAAGLHIFPGAQLRNDTGFGASLGNTENARGSSSAPGCGANSNYDVSWSIRAVHAADACGQLWHTIRHADGSWQSAAGRVKAEIRGNPGPFGAVACAGVTSELQLVAIDLDGDVWHTIRRAGGTWQPRFGRVAAAIANHPGPLRSAACAGVNAELQLVGVDRNGQLWHTIRHADGAWQTSWGLVEVAVSDDPGRFSDATCAGVKDQLHVVGIGPAGRLWHTIRRADGAWQNAFGFIEGVLSNDPGPFCAAACTAVDDELHLVGVGPGGRLWHTIRHADGTWQTALGLVEDGIANDPGPFRAVACTGVNGELHLVAIGPGGRLWHTIRRANGAWQNTFESVDGVLSNSPQRFSAAACANVSAELQLVGLTPPTIAAPTNRVASIASRSIIVR